MKHTRTVVASLALVLGLALTFSSQLSLVAQNLSTTIGKVVLTDTSGTTITPSVDATTNTAAQTTGPQLFGVGSTAIPSAAGADGRSIALWTDLNGRMRITGDASMTKLLVTPDLPSLASTSTKQSDGSQKTQLVDGSGSVIASTSNALNVKCTNCAVGSAATSTLANVSSSATSVTCLASNANRLGVNLYNDSTQVVYLKFGATASSTSYTLQMSSGAYWSMSGLIYTGVIDCIWASANGSARVTELTQ